MFLANFLIINFFLVFPNIHSTFSSYQPMPLNPFFINHSNYTAIAGSDIQVGSQVYLLYEIPTAFLARNFNNSKCDKVKIHVSLFFFAW
jgi:hypothetical protein